MRTPRIYINEKLNLQATIELPKETAQHIITVLKRKIGNSIILFNNQKNTNNQYNEYTGEIVESKRNTVVVKILGCQENITCDSVNFELAQCISKPQHFEVTLQKSVELGVNIITPIISERSEQNIKNSNIDNKMQRWHKIVIGACEQSGRADLPILNNPVTLDEWLDAFAYQEPNGSLLLGMCTKTNNNLNAIIQNHTDIKNITTIIGPEGGFTGKEVDLLIHNNFNLIKLGNRIMRTETAGIVILSILQHTYGDLN